MNNIFSRYYTKDLLFISAIITLLAFISLRTFDEPLRTVAAPGGIVSLEFAKDIDTAKEMINSWNENIKINAALNLGIDYLFLVAYSLFFSISIYLVSNKFQNKFGVLRKIGIVLSILLLVAGLCDAIENYTLIKLLLGSDNSNLPIIAYYLASVKFMVIALGLLYILSGLILKTLLKSD